MNELVKHIAEQSLGTRKHLPPVWQFYDDELEEFAARVIRECLDTLKSHQTIHTINKNVVDSEQAFQQVEHAVTAHFGLVT